METQRPFVEIEEQILSAIESFKTDYDLKITSPSPLNYILKLIAHEASVCKRQNVYASGNLTPSQRRAIHGLERLCKRLMRAKAAQGMPEQFKRRILDIGVGIPSMCSRYDDFPECLRLPENKKQKIQQASTSLFELVVGLSALEIGNNVRLESKKPHGQPDVRFDVGNVTWGIACKVSDSERIERHFSILKEAVAQTVLHLDNNLADRAILVLGVQNAFQRPALSMPNLQAAWASLKTRANLFSQNVQKVIPRHRIETEFLFRDDRIIPGVVVYFEDVFEIVTHNWGIISLGQREDHLGQINYTPFAYAQYITFGDIGKTLSDVPEALAIALTGPDTEPMG